METIKKWQKPGDLYSIECTVDENPPDPIESEEFMIIFVLFHKRHEMGNKTSIIHQDHSSWESIEEAIKKEYDDILVCMPVYMYEHGGIALSTTPFGCRWDSGQIGYAVLRQSTIKSWGKENVPPQDLIEGIKSDVARYGQYLSGFVYRMELIERTVCDKCGHLSRCVIDTLDSIYDIDAVSRDIFGEKHAYIFEHEIKEEN